MDGQYFPQNRAESLIAWGRLVLASFSLLALWLDPSTPVNHAGIAYSLLLVYVIYSLMLVTLAEYLPFRGSHFGCISHLLDMLVFCALVFLTEGSNSPFFVYFIFGLICGTVRWQWRGTLWTAAVALPTFVGIGIYAVSVQGGLPFDLNRFIIRTVYLVVVAVLLGYLGLYEQRRCTEISRLSEWPVTFTSDRQLLIERLLAQAATVMSAPRVLFLWEEPEEPWIYTVCWADGACESSREQPGLWGALAQPPLDRCDFLSAEPDGIVLYCSDTEGFAYSEGAPLDPKLQARFALTSVLGLRVESEDFCGRLLFCDRKRMSSDDLLLGRIVASRLVASLEQLASMRKSEEAVVLEERIRLARDLHDGVLQSLAGIGFRLQVIGRIMELDPPGARRALEETEALLVAEQQALRGRIDEFKPRYRPSEVTPWGLELKLRELGEYIERHWSMKVSVECKGGVPSLPQARAQEIYYIVREALINAAKHAGASAVLVQLEAVNGSIRVRLSDNGCGFPFRGRYEQSQLEEQGAAPWTILERVNRLGGTLCIDSTETGACCEITVSAGKDEELDDDPLHCR